jgi:hypothetical protein
MMPVDNSVRASVSPDHIVGSELVHVHLHHLSVTHVAADAVLRLNIFRWCLVLCVMLCGATTKTAD